MTTSSLSTLLFLATVAVVRPASAFLPSPSISRAARHPNRPSHFIEAPSPIATPATTRIQHPSTSSTSTTSLQSFFGLGPAELAIIAVAGIVVIGPSKLLQFSKEAGEVAGKTGSGLKDGADGMGGEWGEALNSIPEEFKKGVDEGEIEARSRKAKVMPDVVDAVVEEK